MIAFLIFSAAGGSCEEAANEDSSDKDKISVTAEIDCNSLYMWRAIPYSRGSVIQPSVNFSWKKFTFGVWGNMPLRTDETPPDENGEIISEEIGDVKRRFNEMDLNFYYATNWKNLEITPGLQLYLYPSGFPSTGEFVLDLSYPIKNFKIKTTHNLDFIEYKGAYFGEAGIGYSKELSSRFTLDLYAGAGYGSSKFNEAYLGISKSALNNVTGKLSLTYYPNDNLFIRPRIQYDSITDRELRDCSGVKPDNLIFGLDIGQEF